MANTNIGFTINIDGIDNIDQLNAEIKQTNKELKNLTVGTEEYAATSEKLAKLKAEQKALRKSQTELTKSFLEQTNALGSYDKASAKLNRLRKEFKNLAIEGKAASKEGKELRQEIDKLDAKLKQTDASVGQFQRNVGNYPRIFGQSTKAIFKQIPALDKLNKRLEKATGVSNLLGKALVAGFVAFKAAKIVQDVFKQFDELVKKIDEVRNAVSVLAGVGGEELDKLSADVTALSTTFGVDAKEIAKSAEALSNSLGISFEEALGQIENGLKAGQESNEEFLSGIQEAPEAFKDAGEAAGDYADRTNALLEANKELAAAQIDLANEFAGTSNGLKTFATQAQAFLIKTLLAIIDLFRPVVDAFKEVGAAFSELFGLFGKFNKEAGATKTAIDLILQPIKNLAAFLQIVAQALTAVVRGITDFIESSPFLQRIVQELIAGFQRLQKIISELPFIFAGVIEALKQLGTNFKNFFESLFIDAQILAARVKGVFTNSVNDQLKELRARRKEINEDGKSLADAFSEGFQKAADAAAKRRKEREVEQEKANEEALKKQRAKAAQEARKKALEEAKKQRAALQKEREKFLKDEQKFLENQSAIIAKLTERTEKLILDGIQDAQLKARKQAQAASKERTEAAQEEFNSLVELAANREAEALRLFGEGSEELKAAQAQAAKDRVAAEEQLNAILTRERLALTDELLAIDEQFRTAQEKQQEEAARIALQIQRQQLDRRFAEGLESEEEYNKKVLELERERIQAEIDLVSKRLAAGDQENQQLILQKESLLTQLAQLEKAYRDEQKTADQQLAAKQRQLAEERVEQFKEDFAKFVGFAQQGLDFIGQFQDAQIARQKAALEKLAEDNQKSNEILNERLQQASGLEAEFLQQKIDKNVEAAASIAKQQEAIEKDAARKDKARAIIESIINTALAVTQALPNPVAAAIAGVAGAAQTAVIAAQPLATGGKVGAGNIKPLSNGDNVLATLTTGEAVLNADQQRRIGGAPVLAAAGVPGFATGGVVGAPSSLVLQTAKKEQDASELLKRLEEGIAATNGRIDRLEVVYTAQTQDDVERGNKDKEDIQVNASF
jgi:phage-related protein